MANTREALNNLDENNVLDLIDHNKQHLVQIGALFRAHGLTKQHQRYFDELKEVNENLDDIKEYLNSARHRLSLQAKQRALNALHVAEKMNQDLMDQIRSITKLLAAHPVRTYKKDDLVLPIFTKEKPAVIEIKPGQDWQTAYQFHKANPEPIKSADSLLTLTSGVTQEGMTHWIEDIDLNHMSICTIKFDADPNYGISAETVEILTYIDTTSEHSTIKSTIVSTDKHLEVSYVYNFILQTQLSINPDAASVISQTLANYMSSQDPKKHPADANAMKEFFNLSPVAQMLESKGIKPGLLQRITTGATPNNIANTLSQGYKNYFDPNTPLGEINQNKLRSIAITIVENYAATVKDISLTPLPIAGASTPELVREIMIYCHLRNRFAAPSEHFSFENNSRYDIQLTAKQIDDAVDKMQYDLSHMPPSHPLHHLVTDLPFALHDVPKAARKHAKYSRILPQTGFFPADKQYLDSRMNSYRKEPDDLKKNHHRNRQKY